MLTVVDYVSSRLYYDDNCPLCLRTVKIIKQYISPLNISYIPLSSSDLNDDALQKALNYMLLVDSSSIKYWGFDTYIQIFKLSRSPFRLIFKLFSILMRAPLVYQIGLFLYRYIAKNRLRCNSETCSL